MDKILRNVDVLLATPPVYEGLKSRAADKPTVINVFDRIEPMSLRLLKDRIDSKK